DANHDGSGDACQPVVSIAGIRQDGGADLEVNAHASDPQNEPLSGFIAIDDPNPLLLTLPDVLPTLDCSQGFLPEGIPGQGIGFTYGFTGSAYLFDLDSIMNCQDGMADFQIAPGTCDAPAGAFDTLALLDGVPLPATYCVKHPAEPAAFGIEMQVLDIAF